MSLGTAVSNGFDKDINRGNLLQNSQYTCSTCNNHKFNT